MNRYCIEGLFSRGVKVQHDPFKIPDIRATLKKTDSIEKMISNRVKINAPSIWAVMPMKIYPRKGRKISYTMIETKGVHKSFVQKVNSADELWTPSNFCLEGFIESGVKVPIHYMPIGVDTELYRPIEINEKIKSLFKIEKKGFTFVSLFGWSLRKGYDVLLKSYFKTFSKDDDVTLLIISRKNGSNSKGSSDEIKKEIKRYCEIYCPDKTKAPNVIHIGESMPEENLPYIYNMCNAYVLPSRGEGMGMPYMEAGSCELPVISTRCCGMTDFLNDNNSYLVDIEGYGKNSSMKELSSYYQDMPFAVLGEKTIKQLSDTMRFVYENEKESKIKGKILRNDLKENFSWDSLVYKIEKRIGEIQ